MPDAINTQHRFIEDLAIPYASHVTPIEETPYIASGYNVMTSVRRVLERRPGFSGQLEKTLTTFGGRIENIHTWRKWNGSNFVMLSVVTNTDSLVFKLEIGIDDSFAQIFSIRNTEPFSFIDQNNTCYFGNGTPGSMMQFDGKRTVTWGIDRPSKVPVGNIVTVPSGITCQTDYHLRFTYWDAVNGHESSASDVNDCLGQFTNKGIQWSVWASTNPRVTHMRLYRTTDGGSTDPLQMQEISQSPIANVDATVTDYTEDADLRDSFAPGLSINDPPPPLEGFRSDTTRIHGFTGNQTWYSGFDEVTNGVQEECFKGGSNGLSGNVYPWNDEVSTLEVMAGQNPGMSVFLPSNIQIITGELKADISRFPVERKYGARGLHNAASFGSDVAWYDVSGQVRSASIGEISLDIRGEIAKLDPLWVYAETHISGPHKWLCVLDSIAGVLRVYDIDTHKWQTPWPCGATAIHSGEIAPGKRVLYAAINGQIWFMQEGAWNDAGSTYPALLRSGLVPLAPDSNPDMVQAIDSVSIERNTVDIADIRISLDELPQFDSAFASIKVNEGDPTSRREGTSLIERRYTVDNTAGVARRMCVELSWPAEDKGFEVYSINVEIHPLEND
jgi:hypothetical protein